MGPQSPVGGAEVRSQTASKDEYQIGLERVEREGGRDAKGEGQSSLTSGTSNGVDIPRCTWIEHADDVSPREWWVLRIVGDVGIRARPDANEMTTWDASRSGRGRPGNEQTLDRSTRGIVELYSAQCDADCKPVGWSVMRDRTGGYALELFCTSPTFKETSYCNIRS